MPFRPKICLRRSLRPVPPRPPPSQRRLPVPLIPRAGNKRAGAGEHKHDPGFWAAAATELDQERALQHRRCGCSSQRPAGFVFHKSHSTGKRFPIACRQPRRCARNSAVHAAGGGIQINPFEPIAALWASGKLLAELAAQFGNLGLAAAAYNAGPRRVQDWMASRRTLPAETRQYVHSITGRAAEQWARQAATDADMKLPANVRCPDAGAMAAQAGGPITPANQKVPAVSPEALVSGIVGLDARTHPDKVRRPVARGSMPRPSQFAIGLPVSRQVRLAEARHALRSARAKANPRVDLAMRRFAAMAAPVIMTEEKATRRRD